MRARPGGQPVNSEASTSGADNKSQMLCHDEQLETDGSSCHPLRSPVARDLDNIASLLDNRGDYQAAEPLLRRALAIHEKAFGLANPTVAADLTSIGELLANKGDYKSAEPLL
jgi:hypothetical protein